MSSETNPPPGRSRLSLGRRNAKPTGAGQGRVRWKRFAIMFIPAAAACAGLMIATANGALAASFSISGQQGETSADKLTGTGFEQFGDADTTNPANYTTAPPGNLQPVVESEINSATITNLCQSVVENVPIIGTITLRITGGDSGTPATASSLIIDSNQLSGSTAIFSGLQQGIDNSALSNKTPALAGTGNFSQQATSIEIDGLKEIAYSTEAGTFTLPGFSLSLSAGDNSCFPGGPTNNFNL